MFRKELNFFVMGAIASVIGVVFVLSNFSIMPSTTLSSESEGTTITYHSAVCKVVTRTDGTTEDLGCSPNLFNREGMTFIASQVSGANTSAQSIGIVNVIAVAGKDTSPPCITAQANSDDFLCGEETLNGLGRAAATFVRLNNSGSSNGNWSLSNEFTYTGGSAIDLNATGLFNTTTANQSFEIFFAQNTFTTATLNTNDKINITWFIWVV